MKRQPLTNIKLKPNFLKPYYFTALAAVLFSGLVITLSISSHTHAAPNPPSLYLNPATQSVAPNTAFTVEVHENSGTTNINAVQANLSYSTANLTFVSLDYSTSAFDMQAQSSGGSGVINIARAKVSGVAGDQIIAVIHFQTTANTGSSSIAFTSGTVLADSSTNTNILPGLSSTAGDTVTVSSGSNPPTVTLTANPTTITSGSSSTLTWTSTNATSCSATSPSSWTSSTATSGSQSVSSTATTTYTITCTGAGGSTPASATVTVSGGGGTAPTYAQSNSTINNGTSVTSSTDAFPGNVKQGNLIVVAIGYRGNSQAFTINDSLGTQFHPTGSSITTNQTGGYNGPYTGQTEWGVAPSGGADTVTVNFPSTTGHIEMWVDEYNATNPTLDTTAQASGSSTTPDSGPATTTQPNELLYAHIITTGTVTAGGAGWTLREVTGGDATEDRIVSSTGTYDATATTDVNGTWSSQEATFYSSTSSGLVGDLNGDNHVNVFDLSIFLTHWQQSGTGIAEDFNNDNVVNIFDLSILLSHYGT